MDLHLNGLHALVTGSSRGLGYATAHLLAAEGCSVAINSRDEREISQVAKSMAEETGANIVGLSGDVSDPDVPARLVNQTAKEFGGLDILVTNAGGPPSGSIDSIDEDTWQKAIDLSLMSHVRLIRAAIPFLKQSKKASVLTVTSYSVKQPIPNLILSNSVRAATIGLTKSLALELGPSGIRFNSILPAWIETERVYALMSARAEQKGTTLEEEITAQSKDSPFGRMGNPEEFANAAAFLVSPAASYITGVMLTVDGGMYKGTI